LAARAAEQSMKWQEVRKKRKAAKFFHTRLLSPKEFL
jgi:hypothetical protein